MVKIAQKLKQMLWTAETKSCNECWMNYHCVYTKTQMMWDHKGQPPVSNNNSQRLQWMTSTINPHSWQVQTALKLGISTLQWFRVNVKLQNHSAIASNSADSVQHVCPVFQTSNITGSLGLRECFRDARILNSQHWQSTHTNKTQHQSGL